jgi:regulatory protein
VPSGKTTERITKITKTKKGRYAVYFGDKKVILDEDAFTDSPLYVGKEVSRGFYNDLKKKEGETPLLKYALNVLKVRPCTAHMMKEKLEKRSDDQEKIAAVIYRLIKEGLIDDAAYARDYKEEKEAALYGKKRIVDDLLYKKGVSEKTVSSLRFKDEERHASECAKALSRQYKSLPLRKKRERIRQALVLRGFEDEAIAEALSILKEDGGEVRKSAVRDAEAAKARYSRKYEGRELRDHVYRYMLGKGYDYDDISDALEGIGL